MAGWTQVENSSGRRHQVQKMHEERRVSAMINSSVCITRQSVRRYCVQMAACHQTFYHPTLGALFLFSEAQRRYVIAVSYVQPPPGHCCRPVRVELLPPQLRRDMNFAHFKCQQSTENIFYLGVITTAHCDCLLFCALEILLLTYLLTYIIPTENVKYRRGTKSCVSILILPFISETVQHRSIVTTYH